MTENVSRGGARVFTTLPVSVGETITVTDLADKVAVEALVRHVYAGPDRVTRLNLQFPDGGRLRAPAPGGGCTPLAAGGAPALRWCRLETPGALPPAPGHPRPCEPP